MPSLVPAETNLPLSETTALSPLDGRYARATIELREIFSEYACMRARVRVEVEWLLALARLGIPQLPALTTAAVAAVRKLAYDFSLADCAAAPSLFYADWTHPMDDAYNHMRAYRSRLLRRPSFARAVEEARPYRPLFPPGAPDRD